MYARRAIVVPLVNGNKNSYKFNINDPIFCTKNNIINAKILSRYNISGANFYKIGNGIDSKVCKEIELIHI